MTGYVGLGEDMDIYCKSPPLLLRQQQSCSHNPSGHI